MQVPGDNRSSGTDETKVTDITGVLQTTAYREAAAQLTFNLARSPHCGQGSTAGGFQLAFTLKQTNFVKVASKNGVYYMVWEIQRDLTRTYQVLNKAKSIVTGSV